jgi:transposase
VVQAFVMVLACSRMMFVRPVLRMDQTSWCEAHVEAFAFFDGVPARLVYEYVPRNIFVLLCPIELCARQRRAVLVRVVVQY